MLPSLQQTIKKGVAFGVPRSVGDNPLLHPEGVKKFRTTPSPALRAPSPQGAKELNCKYTLPLAPPWGRGARGEGANPTLAPKGSGIKTRRGNWTCGTRRKGPSLHSPALQFAFRILRPGRWSVAACGRWE